MSATVQTSSAERWGSLWGADPAEWAAIEDQQRPTYEEAIRSTGIRRGTRVLDVGCGTGAFLELAAARGAEVSGLDASEELLRVARRRLPGADLRQGDLQALPFDEGAFDVITGFNSFFFADDIVAALREAGRVGHPGGTVVIQVWGRPERCDLTALKAALAALVPPPPASAPTPGLWEPGVLESLATEARLIVDEAFDISWAYRYDGEDALVRSMRSAANVAIAASAVGEEAVRRAIVEGLAPYRTPDGGYRLANEWHFVLASA